MAAAHGATVIATSSTDAKLAFAKKFGAMYVINYRTTPDWNEEVLRLTDGKGVNKVIQPRWRAHTLTVREQGPPWRDGQFDREPECAARFASGDCACSAV